MNIIFFLVIDEFENSTKKLILYSDDFGKCNERKSVVLKISNIINVYGLREHQLQPGTIAACLGKELLAQYVECFYDYLTKVSTSYCSLRCNRRFLMRLSSNRACLWCAQLNLNLDSWHVTP